MGRDTTLPPFLPRKTEKGTQLTLALHSTPEHIVTFRGVLSKKEEVVYGESILFVQKEHGGEGATTLVGACTDLGPGLHPESSLNKYVSCIWKVWYVGLSLSIQCRMLAMHLTAHCLLLPFTSYEVSQLYQGRSEAQSSQAVCPGLQSQ